MYSSPEERHALELRRLRKELEHSNDKVVTLTAQLTTNVSTEFPFLFQDFTQIFRYTKEAIVEISTR